ncbi:MAG TPA: cupin [Bacillales bacterium]|nr:cupin [Bacillales bacterium]
MKIFQFGKDHAKWISRYESDFYMSRILEQNEGVHVGCMFLDAGGKIGYHEAVVPQLLFVIQGEGSVIGSEKVKVQLKAGQAAFWKKGEGHETVTETGMTAIVIESEGLDPEQIMAKWVE